MIDKKTREQAILVLDIASCHSTGIENYLSPHDICIDFGYSKETQSLVYSVLYQASLALGVSPINSAEIRAEAAALLREDWSPE